MNSFTHKISIPVLFSMLALATGCKDQEEVKGNTGRPKELRAEGYVVQPGAFQHTYVVSGSLVSNEQLEIRPEISGRVTDIRFREGSAVSKGQVLIQLYDADIRAQIQKLKAQRQLQVKTLERQKELLNIGGISRQDYEVTETQIASIDADVAFAEAQLRATRIVAPFSGTIGLRNISEGAVVTPTTVIATLQQNHPLKMDFTIPDQYIDAISSGKEVMFSIAGIRDTLTGTISAIDPGAGIATRTIRVRAVVPNPGSKLTAGAFANVIIPIESSKETILIPSLAVIPTTRDKQVAVLNGGKAELKTVELGTRTSDKVEVLNGLSAGDTIVTTGLMQIKPGMEVKITKLKG